jgi:hypothetical protein
MKTQGKPLYSLMPLEDFKALLGIDDREDKTVRFCLVTSTYSIEQYCKRRFLRKKYFENHRYYGDLFILLNEYPVREILAITLMETGELLEPDLYSVFPDCDTGIDVPSSIELSPAVMRLGCKTAKVVYQAGYVANSHPCEFATRSFSNGKTPAKARKTAASMPQVPADLASACLELAAWNMNRYRGRRIGITGNVRKEGEHFELSMPEQVRQLLEPYRRKVI